MYKGRQVNKTKPCAQGQTLMNFYGLESFFKVFFLLCLVSIMCQWIFYNGLILDVEGENSTLYRSIDVYTQKEPYSGRGPHQPSDAFEPQEEVILYAYVTYRDDPVPGKIVAFEAHGPVNRFENLSFTKTAVTDDNGIANVSFRMPWPNGYPEEVISGVWNVIGVVDIAGVTVNDTLSFRGGCIVRILKVETLDSNIVSRFIFMKNEVVHFRLTVESIAFTDKIATLVVDVYDNISVFLGQAVLVDEQIAPGVTVVFVQGFLIPQWASLGDAVVYANAYTALPALGGVPWCHGVSTTFEIVKVIVHDVAVVDVKPSVNEAFPCQLIKVSVVVRNEGNIIETFDVSAYYNSDLIGTLTVKNLVPQAEKNLTFKWCTSCLEPGNYTLRAEASVVPGEVDVEDNEFIDGVVEIKLAPLVECELPKWLLAFLFLLAVLFGATLVVILGFLLLWLHKRREKTEPESSPKFLPYKEPKTCGVCGKKFPATYTFCPYCMSFHGKD